MLESVDLGSLIEGGGSGTLIGLALWRLGSFVRSIGADLKEAREQWSESLTAMQEHYSTEEALLRELRDDRQREEAVRKATAELQRKMLDTLEQQRGAAQPVASIGAHG